MRLPANTKPNEFTCLSGRLLARFTFALLVGIFCSPLIVGAQGAWQAEAIALSHDGRFVAADFKPNLEVNRFRVADGGIWLYDLENLLLPALHLMESRFSDIQLVFSPDNAYVAVVDFEALYVFQTIDGSPVFQLQRPTTFWLNEASARIEFSPDSQYLKTFNIYKRGGPQNFSELHIPIWDFKRGQLANIAVTNPVDPWTKVWFSPDWGQIVVFDQILKFDIETGTGEAIGALDFGAYPGFGDEQGELFHEGRSFFATATHDCIVQIYDTVSWTVSKTWAPADKDCEYGISAFDISRAKPWLAFTNHPTYWDSCDSQEQARLVVWNYEDDIVVFEAATFSSNSRFTQDDRFIVAGHCDAGDDKAQISVWDTENDFEFRMYPDSSPQLHPSSELMVSIGHDSNIWVWNLVRGAPVAILPAIPS